MSGFVALAGGVAFLTTYPLIRLARALGWADAPSSSASDRKLQVNAVPVVGGAAILMGLLALGIGDGVALGDPVFVDHAFGVMF